MAENEDKVDQTEGDKVTGVDVVDGALVLRRSDGSTETFSLADSLPTEDPEENGVLWSDSGTVKVSYSLIGELPISDPHIVGVLWNDSGTYMVSSGP